MIDHQVKISGDGRVHRVEIDGHPVQNMIQTLNLFIEAGVAMPILDLRLVAYRGPDVETRAIVRLDEETTEALKAMGWTPPEVPQ